MEGLVAKARANQKKGGLGGRGSDAIHLQVGSHLKREPLLGSDHHEAGTRSADLLQADVVPLIDTDRAKTVYAIKRSKAPGFAGIDSELFPIDKTFMLFGNAKAVVGELARKRTGEGGH